MSIGIDALTVILLALLLQMVVHRSTLAQAVSPDAAPDAAQIATTDIRLVHRFYPSEWSIPQRAGLAYSIRQNQFFLIRQGKSGSVSGSTLVALTSYGKLAYSVQLNFTIDDALNIAFDDSANRLLLLNRSPAELIAIPVAANGQLDPNAIQRVGVSGFGLRGADSMDVDPQLGRLYILDDTGAKILVANLPASLSAIKVTNALNLSNIRPNKFRGIAVNPVSHNVFVMTHSQRKLLELSSAGELLTSYDLTKLALTQPRDMVFAPSADLTDAADTLHLYITDSRETAVVAADETIAAPQAEEVQNPIFLPLVQNDSNGQLSEQQEQLQDPAIVAAAKAQRLGELLEVALEPQVASVQASAADVESLQLVRTVDMSTYSPPSPDPSGITYLPNSNTLLVTDGEVEETVTGITHFAGANIWDLTLASNPVRTANISKVAPTVAKITNEPTGIAWNPNNNHYYVTDDDALRVYDINPGADNLIGTADDSWTFFDTSAANDVDPEGITYDIATDRLFVSDGINMEIYQYTTAGAYVGQFDVEQYGVSDPESVEYNPESATLYVLSNVDHQIIVEVTPAGALLRTLDASAMQGIAPAGLAYAPASDGSGVKHFYILDRGIDNNADPNIIDGRLFEMTAPAPLPPGTNMPPLVDAGQDLNVALPGQGTLSGVVTDDGLPIPPTLIITWTQMSGPGLVTFANPYSTQTTVAFTLPGSYVVRLSANDGEYIGSDDLNVTVSGTGSVTALNIPINSGSDDAEENSSNSMSLTSTDLDMMIDSGGTPAITMLAIGLRFNGISIPPGATIVNAYLQFVVDEVHTDTTQFTIQGQATDNAATFASSKRSITSRALTTASVQWVPDLWSTVGQSGPAQRSPNLNAIIQQIVNRTGWNANNSLALILSGSGQRVARAYDAGAANAPVLHIEYNFSSPPTSTPTATNTPIPATTTPTATATNTPIPATLTPTSTATDTPVPATATPTGTPIPATATPTTTATDTPIPATVTPTSTPTATATNTPIPATATATNTPIPATVTPTSTPTATATNTPIPATATPTSTATATATSTPTSTSAAIVTRTIAPSADVRVQDNTPTTNYGKSPELRIRSTGPVYRSYLRFTVTGVTGTVQRARIRLYVVDASTMGGAIYLTSNNYVNTTTPWTETGLIWNNAPAVTGPPLSTLGSVALNTWVEFDVTSALQGNGTYNFALTSTATNAAYYSSKEDTAHPPVLVLDIAP